jgi:glutaconyl-CoA decarboxylase
MERKFRITVNGRQYDVTVEEMTEGTSYVLPQPGDMRVPPPPATAQPASSEPPAELSPTGLPSPLAGIVDSIEVAQGDRVEKGQALVIIDAMKMKTTIVAARAGTVTAVFVKPGDAVDGGQTLLSIE